MSSKSSRNSGGKKRYGLGSNKAAKELELPSLRDPDDPNSEHNVCLVRVMGPQKLIQMGILDSFDTLTEIVQLEHVPSATGQAPRLAESTSELAEAAKALSGKTGALNSLLGVMDQVVCAVVVEPKVFPVPGDDEERDPEQLYIDEVDLEDKTCIMQFTMGGTRSLERFRSRQAEVVEHMGTEPSVPMPTE